MSPRHQYFIDTAPFEPLVAEFLQAAQLDVSYAVAIASSAVQIEAKRARWAARSELRAAAREAISACSQLPEFLCEVTEACGTGVSCPFAQPEHAEPLRGVHCDQPSRHRSGSVDRPQPHVNGPRFDLEPAIARLVELQEGSRGAT